MSSYLSFSISSCRGLTPKSSNSFAVCKMVTVTFYPFLSFISLKILYICKLRFGKFNDLSKMTYLGYSVSANSVFSILVKAYTITLLNCHNRSRHFAYISIHDSFQQFLEVG